MIFDMNFVADNFSALCRFKQIHLQFRTNEKNSDEYKKLMDWTWEHKKQFVTDDFEPLYSQESYLVPGIAYRRNNDETIRYIGSPAMREFLLKASDYLKGDELKSIYSDFEKGYDKGYNGAIIDTEFNPQMNLDTRQNVVCELFALAYPTTINRRGWSRSYLINEAYLDGYLRKIKEVMWALDREDRAMNRAKNSKSIRTSKEFETYFKPVFRKDLKFETDDTGGDLSRWNVFERDYPELCKNKSALLIAALARKMYNSNYFMYSSAELKWGDWLQICYDFFNTKK